jgi:hypothetical protein
MAKSDEGVSNVASATDPAAIEQREMIGGVGDPRTAEFDTPESLEADIRNSRYFPIHWPPYAFVVANSRVERISPCCVAYAFGEGSCAAIWRFGYSWR